MLNLQNYSPLLYEQYNPKFVRYLAAADVFIYFDLKNIPIKLGSSKLGVVLFNCSYKIENVFLVFFPEAK